MAGVGGGGGEMGRGRAARKVGVEVGEVKVMSRQVTRATGSGGGGGVMEDPERQIDRRAGGRAGRPGNRAQSGAGTGSELPSLLVWVSSMEITHSMNHL